MTGEYEEKFFNIIELLRKGIRENRIHWQKIPTGSGKISVVLTNFRVVLSEDRVESGVDDVNYYHVLEIQTDLGHPVGEVSASFKHNESLCDKLSNLYNDAFKQCRNLDGAVQSRK